MALKKVFLGEEFMPRQWYNLNADFPTPMPPPLHPGTGNPPGPEDFAPIFPMNLVEQEMIPDRWVDIPEEVLGVYKMWRPTPLYRADRLEKVLDAPVKIYFKNEGVSPAGSHKPNTARAPGLLQQGFRGQKPDHRDRGRAVGLGPFLCLLPVRPGLQGSTWSGSALIRSPTAG